MKILLAFIWLIFKFALFSFAAVYFIHKGGWCWLLAALNAYFCTEVYDEIHKLLNIK